MAGKGPAGAASDIYSIGLIIRQMSGRKYRRVVDRCCRQSPSERYKSIPSLKRAISIRRHLPVAVAVVIFAVFVLTTILPSNVETAVTESSHNALKDRLRREMSTFYEYIVGLLHVAQLSSQNRTKKGYGSFPSGIYLCTKQSNL